MAETTRALFTPPIPPFLRTVWRRPALLYVLSFVFGLLVWEVIAFNLPKVVFASPGDVFASLATNTLNGNIPLRLLGSLQHMALGLALALIVAVPVGFLMGRSRSTFTMFDPIVNAIFSIPSVAFVPFIIIWFGVHFEARVALVFVMCVFDILVTVAAGARNIDPKVIDVARAFSARPWLRFTRVMLPASLPFLFTGLRIGTVRAINAMITAELFFATVNLGAYMEDAKAFFDAPAMLSVVLLLALLGLAAQEGLKTAEARLMPWVIRR